MGFELTAANANESPRLRPLLEELADNHSEITANTEAVMADKGYDSADNCEYVVEQMDAQAIIKMRRYVEGDEICQAAICRCNELGTPICASNHKMVYWGRDGDYLKWRCPVAVGAVAMAEEEMLERVRRTVRLAAWPARAKRGSQSTSRGRMYRRWVFQREGRSVGLMARQKWKMRTPAARTGAVPEHSSQSEPMEDPLSQQAHNANQT